MGSIWTKLRLLDSLEMVVSRCRHLVCASGLQRVCSSFYFFTLPFIATWQLYFTDVALASGPVTAELRLYSQTSTNTTLSSPAILSLSPQTGNNHGSVQDNTTTAVAAAATATTR